MCTNIGVMKLFLSFLTEVCTDQMGLENGLMADQQFTASSVHDDDRIYGPAQARLNGESSWVPTTHHNQWIQVLKW